MVIGADLLKKKKYQIIWGRADSPQAFEEEINRHLEVGWKLYGDIFLTERYSESLHSKYTCINQAIIKSPPQSS